LRRLQASLPGSGGSPTKFFFLVQELHEKSPPSSVSYFRGEPTGIILEHLFDDLFTLRDWFQELGMVIKNGKIYLPDLQGSDDKLD
jgi:hypothetical protein